MIAPKRLLVAVGAAVAFLAVLAALAYGVYDKGKQDAKDEIGQQNAEAGDAAHDAAVSWRECLADGGVYDFASGECGWAP